MCNRHFLLLLPTGYRWKDANCTPYKGCKFTPQKVGSRGMMINFIQLWDSFSALGSLEALLPCHYSQIHPGQVDFISRDPIYGPNRSFKSNHSWIGIIMHFESYNCLQINFLWYVHAKMILTLCKNKHFQIYYLV